MGLWEGQTQSPREKKPHPGGITYIDVQCAQAETLLWALGGRVVSFPVYSIVSMLFCFFSTPLKDVKIKKKKIRHSTPMGSYAQTKLWRCASGSSDEFCEKRL